MAKIAHIANLYGPKSGGLKTAMNSIAQEYTNIGHEVMLIVPGERDLVTKKPFGTAQHNEVILPTPINSSQYN